jgi:histidyl-tRNA synthetase
MAIDSLPGFRDFYPDETALRAALFGIWRSTVRSFGFQEMDAPVLESMDLYKKKSGDELVGQLFDFKDRGGRHVAMRPEMTPTVARMIAAKERDFRKPIKWFSIASFFRFERQQKGRLREFVQLNCDLVGDATPDADAEMITLLVEILRACGLGPADVAIRVSDRNAWSAFLAQRRIDPAKLPDFLTIIDKLDRADVGELNTKLKAFAATVEKVREFASQDCMAHPTLAALRERLEQRGVIDYITFDLSIVRGLAYYTGVVFEAFDRKGEHRAIAGGGRYDTLLSKMSDGSTDLPALGFGMGDVVFLDVIRENAEAAQRLDELAKGLCDLDVYAIVADEAARKHALRSIAEMRRAGLRVDYPFGAVKVAKQFQNAEQAGARMAVVFGAEWPMVRLKTLATREESPILAQSLVSEVQLALRLR